MSDRPTPSVVLLVADDPSTAANLEMCLAPDRTEARPSWSISTATCAAAPAIARRSAIDVAIVAADPADLVDVVRDLRRAAPSLAVIAIGSPSDRLDHIDLLQAGAQEVLAALPSDAAEVAPVLRDAVARQTWARELLASMRHMGVAAEHWPLLDELSRIVTAAATTSDAMNGVTQLLVPIAADCALIWLSGDEDGRASLALRHVDRALEPDLRAHIEQILDAADSGGEEKPSESTRTLDDLASAIAHELSNAGIIMGRPATIRIGGDARGVLALGSSAPVVHDVAGSLARAAAHRIAVALEVGATLRRAREAVAARDRAISMVSHDLVTPLTTIQMGASALLRTDPLNASFTRHAAELIERSATLMQQILHDLLDQASLDAGELRLARQATLIEQVIEAVHDNLARLAEERQILFVCSSPADTPRVDADPERLLQVLFNLVANAIKFTPPRGRVELSVRSVQSESGADSGGGVAARPVRFAVQDTGAGIPAEDLPHVFEWFWHSSDAARGGTGLGLAIAHALVAAHGSELEVESIPGRGTTFWFELPEFVAAEGNERSAP